MAERLRVAIVGSGYTGAETLRACLAHPRIELVGLVSRQGRSIGELWPQLDGLDLPVGPEIPEADAVFLCLPHGEAKKMALPDALLIDLSADHRHALGWVYGLPEKNAALLPGARRVANPGCFATALALSLLPLAGELPARVGAVGLTGSTGSGASPTAGTHHPSRAENLRPYKVLAHQHVPEVVAALGGGFALDFVPISAPLRRGILTTIQLPGVHFERFAAFYAKEPFVRVRREPPEVLHVLGSNRADLGVVEADGQSVVFCAIDNLSRGAGTQALVNLNLVMGWPATLGLGPGLFP